MNPNPNINAQNDPLNAILANLPPIHVQPNLQLNMGLIHGNGMAQAAQNLAQHVAAQALLAPVGIHGVGIPGNEPGTPPGQMVPQAMQPPGAPRRLGPGLHVFQPVLMAQGGNLQDRLNAVLQQPVTPVTLQSNQSAQDHFSPPSVCKPGINRSYHGDDSDNSSGAGRGRGVRF